MMVRNLARKMSDTIAPSSGKKYAPDLNSACQVAALASPNFRKSIMYATRIALMP